MSKQRHIRRHGPVWLVSSAPEGSVPEPPPPYLMRSRIADSVEGPNGNNPGDTGSGSDTAEGLALDLISTGAQMSDPSQGIGWSIPARNTRGQRVTSFPSIPLQGWIRLEIVEPPSNHAVPSNVCVWAGITSDGPIATATRAIAFGLKNTTAGEWIVSMWYRNGGVWMEQVAAEGLPTTNGLHAGWGAPHASSAQVYGMGARPLPSATAQATRVLGLTLSFLGDDAHFFFGGGWAGSPADDQSVVIRAYGHLGEDPDTLLEWV